jgi:leader peptidase (prepilin peptidase) / N-methyltransferase
MELALALILGLVIGSFLNVCILRLPHGMSVMLPRSHCPQCRKLIPWYDNVPILSFLLLKGRCRHCGKPISARYPLIEAASGIVSVLLFVKFGLGLEWFIFLCFSSALLVLAFIDVDHRILPDVITLNGIWIGVLTSVYLARPSPIIAGLLKLGGFNISNARQLALFDSLLGMVVGGGLLWFVAEAYLRLRGIEGMGFGDVKMMAMVGAFLGAPLALFTIMVGSLLGSIIGLVFIRLTDKTREYELPFGTFLGIAGIIAVLYGETLVSLYVDRMIRPAL